MVAFGDDVNWGSAPDPGIFEDVIQIKPDLKKLGQPKLP